MKRAEVTEKILTAKRLKELSWEEIAKKIGGASKIIVTAACMGQMKMTKEQATKAAKLFGLGKEETLLLQEVPYRGSLPQVPPTDPLIYRFYELVQVYGTTWKELIQEEFGDGIMSRHRLRHDHGAPARPEGRPREDRHVGQVPALQDLLRIGPAFTGRLVYARSVNNRRSVDCQSNWPTDLSLPDLPRPGPEEHVPRPYRRAVCGRRSWPATSPRRAVGRDGAVGALRRQPRAAARGVAPADRGRAAGDGALHRHARRRRFPSTTCARSIRCAPRSRSFAFEQIWQRRDDRFRAELRRRNEALLATIDARRRPRQHPRPSSTSTAWSTRRAATGCCSAPGTACAAACSSTGPPIIARTARRGPRRDSHDSYITAALGDDLDAMRAEIADHMRRGAATTETFLRSQPSLSGNRRGETTT